MIIIIVTIIVTIITTTIVTIIITIIIIVTLSSSLRYKRARNLSMARQWALPCTV